MATYDVFLSHNSNDTPVVTALAEALKARGLNVWLDEWELVPGRPWQQALEEIIKTVNSAAVLIGKDGLGPWEEPEMRGALDQFVRRKSPVIPVLLPDASQEPELPLFLTGFTWVDFRRVGITDEALDKLVWGITGSKPQREDERFADLTTYACHRIAEIAGNWLARECNPFVLPAVSRRVPSSESMMSSHDGDPWELMDDDESRGILFAQFPLERNRVRVFGGSGTGKTALLHYSELQIASTGDGILPVRIDALSSYDWRGDVPATLANRVLHTFLPADTDESARTEWFSHLIDEHQVAFLFDAVDQTDDQLSGLSQFLQSADVCDCPVILTGRPEVEHTRASVFQSANWKTCRLEPFDERRIRQYLGNLVDKLLPLRAEAWTDPPSWKRKQQWSDLLHVPLLLQLMRHLAADETEGPSGARLVDLHNRHAIYHAAVRHLIEQGWSSLSQTPNREDLLDHAEAAHHLSDIAWVMVSSNNFTGLFQGELFRRWRAGNRQAVRALEQVDLTTRFSLLDHPGEFGLAWRHLSFCEYFAGKRLASMERSDQETVVKEHGRSESWGRVFRFALSELAAEHYQCGASDLARDLVRFGNPFLVYDVIRVDGLTLPEQLDTLCRWLVRREWSTQGDYREAWKVDMKRPAVDEGLLRILDTMFDRSFRDSRHLEPAWELLTSSSDALATDIQRRFLTEFRELTDGPEPSKSVARSLSLDEHFVRCPPAGQENQSFHIGDNADQMVETDTFLLGIAPITNLQFELFDPSHLQWRDEASPDDASPVVYVNWPMAAMFCTWLGEGHRLPTELEWEIGCRAGTSRRYWWGDEFDATKCNLLVAGGWGAMPADPDHANDWGLMDMCGNVDEWCADRDEHDRVIRGGAWGAGVEFCLCSSRLVLNPESRKSFGIGFRLARSWQSELADQIPAHRELHRIIVKMPPRPVPGGLTPVLPTWPTSVQAGSNGFEVALVQSLLNEENDEGLKVDGIFGPVTEMAIEALQRRIGLGCDGIVGPNTWGGLFQNTERYAVHFKADTAQSNGSSSPETVSLYESQVKIHCIQAAGMRQIAIMRGSNMPDADASGRLKTGWYRLHLGFHLRSIANTDPSSPGTLFLSPTAADMVVRTDGNLRPCLVVNEDTKVEVCSNDSKKKYLKNIHIHNGFETKRDSSGDPTISPDDWPVFIKHFLDSYTSLDDWHDPENDSPYRGRDIGVMILE